MKHAGIFLTISMLLCFTATAQKDTLLMKIMEANHFADSILLIKHDVILKADTLYLKSGQLYHQNGSLYNSKGYANADNRTYLVINTNDSGFKKYKTPATIYKAQAGYKKTDSAYSKMQRGYRGRDSLYRISTNLYKIQNINYRNQQKSYDSLRKLNWKSDTLRWKKDSVRIKGQLMQLKSDLQRLREDTAVRNKNMRKREISMEVNCNKNGNVYITNLSRKIVVKTYNEDKVKIVTTIFAYPEMDSKDVDWARVLNVTIEQNKNDVVIKSNNTRTTMITGTASGSGSISMAYSNSNTVTGGNVVESKMYLAGKKSELIIYIPATAKLKIENKYNDISIASDLQSLDADLVNTNLKMQNAAKAIIKSRYGTVNAGDIKNGDIDLLNCKFTSDDIDQLTINSKYSTVTFGNSRVINITSVSDQYKIESVAEAKVNKNFGKLNIDNLTTSIEMTGSSADVNINGIGATATLIRINNKYADVKLELKQLQNYTMKLEGKYSNFYSDSEKIKSTNTDSMNAPFSYTKTVGNVSKKFTAFDVSCSSCSVDFR